MRNKRNSSRTPEDLEQAADRRQRIRNALERKGVAPGVSLVVAERLATIAPDLSADEYARVLDGVAIACTSASLEPGTVATAREHEEAHDVEEIERLMKDFAVELRKLEEGLRILSAYLRRMRVRAGARRGGALH